MAKQKMSKKKKFGIFSIISAVGLGIVGVVNPSLLPVIKQGVEIVNTELEQKSPQIQDECVCEEKE